MIDAGWLHSTASAAGLAERYGRGETSHTIHVWWARRPHRAMRALVFAALCRAVDTPAGNILRRIGLSLTPADKAVDDARALIASRYDPPPRLLDMFGGGGTIAFEAMNMGARTHALDANLLSVFIQKCNLIYSQKIDPRENIQRRLRASGTRVLNQLREETGPLYPLRNPGKMKDPGGVSAYLWTYSYCCPACGYRFYLTKRPWLTKKAGKRLAFVVSSGQKEQGLSLESIEDDYIYPSVWGAGSGKITCPRCRTRIDGVDIHGCDDEMVAMIRSAPGRGKEFMPADPKALPGRDLIRDIEKRTLVELAAELPDSTLPVWSGIVNPALYGVRTHADFLNLRQRAVLILLVKALYDEYERLRADASEAAATYVIGLLSALIDQIVDWNCRLSMWIPQNEQVGRAFCGPGISMLWDYVETDPVSNGPSNLWYKLNRIVKGSQSIPRFPGRGHVAQAHAQSLPYPDDYFDAIVTDPPYYDNLYYSVLADFFYAWKRLLLQKIEPDIFEAPSTECDRELVASKYRNGTGQRAHRTYCEQLERAVAEAARVLKPQGVFCLIYSHSSLNGWDALVGAYRAANLVITTVQPLSIERRQRPRAMTSRAVNTCLTFVARKSDAPKATADMSGILNRFREICAGRFITNLERSGWAATDAGMAAFAQGVALLANHKKTRSGADMDALIALGNIVRERIPGFRVSRRKSL